MVPVFVYLCAELKHWMVSFVFSRLSVRQEAALTHVNVHTLHAAIPENTHTHAHTHTHTHTQLKNLCLLATFERSALLDDGSPESSDGEGLAGVTANAVTDAPTDRQAIQSG